MSRSPALLRRTVAAAAVTAVALTAVGAASAPGLAASVTARPHRPAAVSGRALAAGTLALSHARRTTGTETVELRLTPRNRAGLRALAQAHGLSDTSRLGRLHDAIAGPVRAHTVADRLRSLGLTVTSSDDFAVSAEGPAAVVAALFGTAQATELATAQALPVVPRALAGLVTVAYGGNDDRPAELPLGTTATATGPSSAAAPTDGSLSIAQSRSLYGTAATTTAPARTAPIVATLQFTSAAVVQQAVANANTFATNNDLYAGSSYHPSTNIAAVSVAADCRAAAGADDGVEVGLDQETLLSVAPQARQRIYTVPNCGDAQDEALDRIASDVAAGQPIIALSTSWGECERAENGSGASQVAADEDAVDEVLAQGVTMFAASGDNGSFDCVTQQDAEITTEDAVDSPAALSGVVGVGGTEFLTSQPSTSTQAAWNNSGGATGGGYSCGYVGGPAYQASLVQAASYPTNGLSCPAGSSERAVPDIAEDGGEGIDAVITDVSQDGPETMTGRVYGTSFAAPLAAAGLTETLLRSGQRVGLGDIHDLLYSSTQFHDVTSGGNGDYSAATGYDPVTGLGTPVWPALLSSTRDLSDISVASDGTVEITRALADDGYHAESKATPTALHVADASQWRFLLAPYGGDAASDLWAVRLSGDSSGHVVVYVFSQKSGYTHELQARVTAAEAAAVPADWDARVSGYGADHGSDLFLLHDRNTQSGHVELFALTQASSYHAYVAERITGAPASADYSYFVGDVRGDLFGVSHVGSGRVNVSGIAESGSYHRIDSVVTTPFARTTSDDGSPQFAMSDVTGDGYPDLEELVLTGNGSGAVELHAVAGPAYTKIVLANVTALPDTMPTTDTWTIG